MKKKEIGFVCIALAALYALGLIAAACAAPVNAAGEPGEKGISPEYETKLFKTDVVHTINIEIAEADWADLKSRALYKETHDATLVVDGETFYHVEIRTKGNSTLAQSIVRDWDRQSLTVDFGSLQAGQRYYGLDTLSLYNNACDASCLKNMLCLDMMRRMGVPSPLSSFAAVFLNGEYMGLYTAMEGVGEAFAARNFGLPYGQLYKPEHLDIAAILTGTYNGDIVFNLDAFSAGTGSVEINEFLQTAEEAVALRYVGESLSAYDQIWDNAVFKVGRSDQRRVVTALRHIGEQNDVWRYADMEELARYFAVNAFVLNTDNYLTNMAHNYYLYEDKGVLSMLPWDYDLTLGAVGAVGTEGSMTDFLNLAIDTPLIHSTMAQRPMLACVLNDPRGTQLYHEALQTLLNTYIYSEYCERYLDRNAALIAPYVKEDPLHGGSTERFEADVSAIRQFCAIRSASIQGQLDGTIPSTIDAQALAPDTLIDASDFSSPDSGGFLEMMLPKGSGLTLDDAIERLGRQVRLLTLLKMVPLEKLRDLPQLANGSGGTLETLQSTGYVSDPGRIKEAVLHAAYLDIRDVGTGIAAVLVLAAALVRIRQDGRRRQPQARKRGTAA